jgi:hypothetical protein
MYERKRAPFYVYDDLVRERVYGAALAYYWRHSGAGVTVDTMGY